MRLRFHTALGTVAMTDEQVLADLCPPFIPPGTSSEDAAAIQADALASIAQARRLAALIGDEIGEADDSAEGAACGDYLTVNFQAYGSRFPAPAAWFEPVEEPA